MTEPWHLPLLEDHLDSVAITPGSSVVDIGCGDGWFVRRLADRDFNVVGVECGVEQLRRARAADPLHADRYVSGVGQALPLADHTCDAAVFVFSLHHVPEGEMEAALHEARRVVRPGGTVTVIEPVAAGLGHDVDALVDDETHVRAVAQAAIDRATPEIFVETAPRSLTMGSSYGSFDDYASILVGIDPHRGQIFGSKRDQVEQAFYANAVEHDGRWWFEDHLLIRHFT